MIKLHEFKVNQTFKELNPADISFLNLSGYKSFHTQGIYGQNTIVAVVDTGVSPHMELRGRLLQGRSFVNYTRRPYDDNGHGTHVAGSIAGRNVGVAPGAQILPVKVLDAEGNGSLNDLIRGLDWVYEYSKSNSKVSVVNMSLSVEDNLTEEEKTALHNSIKKLVENNIAVIVSSGNTGKDEIRYPAAFDEVISVGAVDTYQKRAMFSTMGEHIDVCQVGVDVVSAWYKGGYASMTGTSMSTPIVSGIAALLASKYYETFKEDITEDLLWKMIKFNTKDLGIPGADREYGTGFATLQPLELKLEAKNNSDYLKINDEVYQLNSTFSFNDGEFVLPGGIFGNATGAYIQYTDDELLIFEY